MTFEEAIKALQGHKSGDPVSPEIEAALRGKIWDYCQTKTRTGEGCLTKTGDMCNTCQKWICTLHQREHLASHI